jgi:hypothetical protein
MRSGRCSEPDALDLAAVAELVVRLTGVMRREFVMDWLRRPDIPALDGRSPLDLLADGQLDRVARLISALEDPGAI